MEEYLSPFVLQHLRLSHMCPLHVDILVAELVGRTYTQRDVVVSSGIQSPHTDHS